jgi:transposase
MSDEFQDLRRRLVVGHKADGRSVYDEQAKAELVAPCMQPDASVSRLARECGVNANRFAAGFESVGTSAGRAKPAAVRWAHRRHDGAALREIGVEASEQLDIIPQQVRVIRHERVKYACPCCDGGLRLAARPAQVIPKGLFTECALAWMATAKYLDGLPLYRQVVLLGRFGGTDISRNTVAAGMVRVGQAVQPVINLLRDELLTRRWCSATRPSCRCSRSPGAKHEPRAMSGRK